MKLRFDPNSIKFRIWLYFILFAAGLMLLLWFLQIFFLNNYYSVMKEETTDKAATLITNKDLTSDDDEDFISTVESISAPNDIYTYFETEDGYDAFSSFNWGTKATSSTYFQEKTAARQRFLSSNSADNTYVFKTTKPDSTNETLVYASKLTKGGKSMYMYVFSPLYPMDSTISILSSQLTYITVIAIILSVLLSFFLSTRISNPIRNISRSADRLAKGEYGIVFKGGHFTEISNLADTLTRASIKLEKTEVMQKDLIANVSHDLRTPLTMIKSYAEMIQDISGNDPEKRGAHLQVIMDEADRLNHLVSDMLALSRMQSGAVVINKDVFDLQEMVKQLLNSYALLQEQDGYDIRLESKDRFIPVNADEERIKQVLSNLINNAVKFCGTDKQVIVTLKRRGNKALCQVIDHGVGIPQAELEYIWERYYRASSNMVRSKQGTGLGLSIVKEILTLHKANFGVNSKIGYGTTFWFELDMARQDAVRAYRNLWNSKRKK